MIHKLEFIDRSQQSTIRQWKPPEQEDQVASTEAKKPKQQDQLYHASRAVRKCDKEAR